jgi:fluoroacetyl-CoA thioesterase
MKEIFKAGDIKQYATVVKPMDVARFQGSVVHEVYSTFALARDIEWTTRLFAMDMKEEDEEGVGTLLEIRHHSPAFVGEELLFTGRYERLFQGELLCSFEVHAGARLVATGRTGQKILKVEKIKSIFRHG